MCKVKIKEHIANYGDVQNVVMGTILRQKGEYKDDHILTTVMQYCQGARITVDRIKTKIMIAESLDILQRNNRIICNNGMFKTRHALPIKSVK